MLIDAAHRQDTRIREDMEKVELYLSLGSNQGDREHYIETALSLLNIELKTPYKAVSSLQIGRASCRERVCLSV